MGTKSTLTFSLALIWQLIFLSTVGISWEYANDIDLNAMLPDWGHDGSGLFLGISSGASGCSLQYSMTLSTAVIWKKQRELQYYS